MRAATLLPLAALAAQAAALYVTKTVTDDWFVFFVKCFLDFPRCQCVCSIKPISPFAHCSVYWSNPVGPTITQTVPGATTTTTNAGATLTETATVEAVAGFTTFTVQPTPPARMGRRAKVTTIEDDVCTATSTLTVYPTATYSDPKITSTVTAYGHTATTTTTTSFTLY